MNKKTKHSGKLEQMAVDKAIESSRAYINRLIAVAIAANEVVEGAEKGDRCYLRVTKQRLNALRRALEALRKQQQRGTVS